MIIKPLIAVILMTASAIAGFSQTRSVEHDFSPFDAIEASSGFKVSTTASDSYAVKLTIDDILESYVECYVKAGTLHLSLDDKSIPKDLKRQYKGRNSADPTLVAIVYMPTLKSITLNDNSEFFNSPNFSGDNFKVTLNGTSKISDMKIVAKTVNVNLSKNAQFTNANITTEGDLAINMDGKSSLSVNCAAENLLMTATGSSEASVNGKIEGKVDLTVGSSSKTTLKGNSGSFELNGKGISAKVDVIGMPAKNVVISLSGADASVAPTESIELDLGKGAEITYSGDPSVKIVKIQNATVIRQ